MKEFSNSLSKVNRLIEAVHERIIAGCLSAGDNLPSINEMSREFGVSRDTVFKAYSELKKRGVIDSTPMKGYYVKDKVHHVLLLLDTYSPFKEILYRNLVENLRDLEYRVDVLFHQYNERLFRTIIRDSAGHYSYYLVMNFSNDRFSEELKAIPADKLLLLDFGNFDKGNYSYLCQDFNQAFYDCLVEADECFAKYGKVVLFFPKELMHPASAIDYFVKYCNGRKFEYEVLHRGVEEKDISKGCAYICLKQPDLVDLVRGCERLNYRVGEEVGILVYNDMPVLEIIEGGITSVSVDFAVMGQKAADFIKSGERIQKVLPTRLILRNSL